MDANESPQTARDCVNRAIVAEIVRNKDTKELHITFRITRTQDNQDTRCARSMCTIDDADGRITFTIITDCPFCDRKCANQASCAEACSAEQNEQPNRATSIFARIFAWWDSRRYLYPAFGGVCSAVGLATVLTLYFGGKADGCDKTLMLIAAGAGFFIGLFVGGLRALKRGSQRPDSNKRNRSGK